MSHLANILIGYSAKGMKVQLKYQILTECYIIFLRDQLSPTHDDGAIAHDDGAIAHDDGARVLSEGKN
jgi:hypothetical protein